MIFFEESQDNILNEIVISSYKRVVTPTQITSDITKATIIIVIDSSKLLAERLSYLYTSFSKIIIHGKLNHNLYNFFDIQEVSISIDDLYETEGDFPNSISNSKGYVSYYQHELTSPLTSFQRHLTRFDFTDEWNNLGYGLIPNNNSIWSISSPVISNNSISDIFLKNEKQLSFITIKDLNESSILWINREVGLPDCYDWTVVENFISSYRYHQLATLPILMDIPYGYDAAVTMRLDCDENVYSCTPLLELYDEYRFPLSIAIKTEQNLDQKSITLCKGIIENGGSIHSHSHTHAPDWGRQSNGAIWEMETSSKILRELIGENFSKDSVVSPFHQNSLYSVKELEQFGVKSFVGGIVKNDPEYLIFRSGIAPFSESISTHSQQCMLHGDCYHDAENSLDTYKKSFQLHKETQTFFGFLDHPFSSYSYGWTSENERLEAHREFLLFIKSHKNTAIMNLNDTMTFIQGKKDVQLSTNNNKASSSCSYASNNFHKYGYRFNNQVYEV